VKMTCNMKWDWIMKTNENMAKTNDSKPMNSNGSSIKTNKWWPKIMTKNMKIILIIIIIMKSNS
jgi:hypothetical protein